VRPTFCTQLDWAAAGTKLSGQLRACCLVHPLLSLVLAHTTHFRKLSPTNFGFSNVGEPRTNSFFCQNPRTFLEKDQPADQAADQPRAKVTECNLVERTTLRTTLRATWSAPLRQTGWSPKSPGGDSEKIMCETSVSLVTKDILDEKGHARDTRATVHVTL